MCSCTRQYVRLGCSSHAMSRRLHRGGCVLCNSKLPSWQSALHANAGGIIASARTTHIACGPSCSWFTRSSEAQTCLLNCFVECCKHLGARTSAINFVREPHRHAHHAPQVTTQAQSRLSSLSTFVIAMCRSTQAHRQVSCCVQETASNGGTEGGARFWDACSDLRRAHASTLGICAVVVVPIFVYLAQWHSFGAQL